jgi:hypothetical protein
MRFLLSARGVVKPTAIVPAWAYGHKDLMTTTRFYKKATLGATARGMQMMNEEITKQK